jgi:pyruvate formate lyase activating enzyme
VCITGGEPLLQKDLRDLIVKIKEMGYAVKLDTNGSFPQALKSLVEDKLVDYVAMDVKNCPEKYALTADADESIVERVDESIKFLLSSVIPYEFRTTVVKEFHDAESFQQIAKWISGAEAYYLQSFVDSDEVLEKGLHAYEPEELEAFRQMILPEVPSAKLRGVEVS